MPWWGITLLTLLGTGAVVYGSYASYLYIKEAQKKKRFIEDEVVPRVLASRGIPAFPSRRTAGSDSMTRLHAAEARDRAYGAAGSGDAGVESDRDDAEPTRLGGMLYPDNYNERRMP